MKINASGRAVAASLLAATLAFPAFGNEGAVPKGVPHLDHVFARPQGHVVFHFDGRKQVSELRGELSPDGPDAL